MGACSLAVSACSGGAQTTQMATPTLTAGEAQGKKVFEQHCASCHSTIPDSIIVGPSLAGVGQRADSRIVGMAAAEYIEMSIKKPAAYLVEGYPDLMPPTISEELSEEEIYAVMAYLMTLGK